MTKIAKGFTLIELLVVIVIIGILATLATVTLGSARSKARDARRVSDIKQIQTALELFYNDNLGYPVAASVTTVGGPIWATGVTYMTKVPGDPGGDTLTAGCPSSNGNYLYAQTGTVTAGLSTSYTMGYCLFGTTGSITSGSHAATPAGITNP